MSWWTGWRWRSFEDKRTVTSEQAVEIAIAVFEREGWAYDEPEVIGYPTEWCVLSDDYRGAASVRVCRYTGKVTAVRPPAL